MTFDKETKIDKDSAEEVVVAKGFPPTIADTIKKDRGFEAVPCTQSELQSSGIKTKTSLENNLTKYSQLEEEEEHQEITHEENLVRLMHQILQSNREDAYADDQVEFLIHEDPQSDSDEDNNEENVQKTEHDFLQDFLKERFSFDQKSEGQSGGCQNQNDRCINSSGNRTKGKRIIRSVFWRRLKFL